MTDRELMQQALEALLWEYGWGDLKKPQLAAITALRERLAQPVQEPLATVESVATVVSESGNQEITMSWWHEPALPVGTKLYTSPPKAAEWVGLTDDEVAQAMYRADAIITGPMQFRFAKEIEVKLKEKNT